MNLSEKSTLYKQTHTNPPAYANVDIIWNDTGGIMENIIIKLSCDADSKTDHLIFFYVNGVEELESLCTPGSQDFTVIESSIELLEEI